MSPLWVVLVNYNGLEDTCKCLRSLAASRHSGLSAVVVDNASAVDPTSVLRDEFPWCDLVRNPVNGGWAGGNNVGIRHALEHRAEYVLLLNNDTTVSPDAADRLLAAAEAHPAFGVIGPVIYFMDDPEEVMTDGVVFNRSDRPGFFQRFEVPLQRTEPPRVLEVDIVNGCAMMISAEVFRQIGLIDERFFLIHEESDFCLRAQDAGFRCGVLGEGLVWHKGSSSFKRSGRSWQRYYDARNLALLLQKHPASAGRRNTWQARREYLKYVYYRYAIEREEGHAEAADAVLQGLHDAIRGYYGPYAFRSRWTVPLLRSVFECWRQYKTRKSSRKETACGAATLR